ncbi:MAG: hypothetical protein Q4G31_08885 [bacterium]|nr:hypothetical protein [bacterium]
MQKRSLEISCYVCGAGAFGVFFRWLQDQMAFDEAGLAERSVFNYLVPLAILAAALLFNRFIEQAKAEKLYIPTDYCQALRNEGRLFAMARWACGLVMALGGVLLIASCETDKDAKLMYILAGLAIASGLCYPLLLGSANDKYGKLRHPTLACAGTVLPVLLFALWLVLCYKQNALNSVVWSYLIEIATTIVALLAFFRAAGFAYGAVKTWPTLFTIMLGVMMCIMSLADERYIGMHIIMLGAALQLLMYEWVLIMNMQKKAPKPKEERLPG